MRVTRRKRWRSKCLPPSAGAYRACCTTARGMDKRTAPWCRPKKHAPASAGKAGVSETMKQESRGTQSGEVGAMRWDYTRVLVTGGASFIGSALVDELVERGARVRVIDNLS